MKQLIRLQANLIGRNRRSALAPSRESGARGSYFSEPLALVGKSGLQPQSKPPVHTGGFDYKLVSIRLIQLAFPSKRIVKSATIDIKEADGDSDDDNAKEDEKTVFLGPCFSLVPASFFVAAKAAQFHSG